MMTKYTTEHQRRMAIKLQQAKCQKKTMTPFMFRFHNVNDEKVIAKLKSVPNKVDYVRQLILKDINKGE